MKNFYKQLKISSNASHDQIIKALDHEIRSAIKEDAKFVLLNRDRKRVFDRCNDSLEHIGKLRANLGLDYAPNWVDHNFTDYRYKPDRNGSIIDEITNQNKTTTQYRSYSKNTNSRNNTSHQKSKNNTITKGESNFGLGGYFVLTLIVIVFMVYIGNNGPSNSTGVYDENQDVPTISSQNNNESGQDSDTFAGTNSNTNRASEPSFDKEPSPLPINGYIDNYTSREELAPLEIKTPRYSDHYFVVLDDYYSGERALILFIRGGQSVDIKVPLGTYRIKYATGENWYGMRDLFGPGDMTTRFKTNDIFEFKDQGYQYIGYTLELIEQVGGNMYTEEVSVSEW